jgi:hypothetical protein
MGHPVFEHSLALGGEVLKGLNSSYLVPAVGAGV